MTLSEKIKFECFIAFIHSRLIGLGVDKETNYTPVLTEENEIDNIAKLGNVIINQLGQISTLARINEIIANQKSGIIGKMYQSNYEKLLKPAEDKVKKGDDVINSTIGIEMLNHYISYVKKYDTTITIEQVKEILDIYKTKCEDYRRVVFKMTNVANYITHNYWNETKTKGKKCKMKK
jgi:hypothetical protein